MVKHHQRKDPDISIAFTVKLRTLREEALADMKYNKERLKGQL